MIKLKKQPKGTLECGIACIYMLVEGINPDEIKKKKCLKKIKDKKDRTDWEEIIDILDKCNLKCGKIVKSKSWKAFKDNKLKDKRIFLAAVNYEKKKKKKENWHWVVLEKSEGIWHIFDPNTSRKDNTHPQKLSSRSRTRLWKYAEIKKK